MSMRKWTVLCSFAFAVKLAIALVSMALGSTLMPTPGFHRLITMRPMMRAAVVTSSK